MEYISSFTKTLVCVIIISFILKSLLPQSTLEKYINFVIGLIISVTLVGAFSNTEMIRFEEIALADISGQLSEYEAKEIYDKKLADALKESIKANICDTVTAASGLNSECDVMLRLDPNGGAPEIEGIYVRLDGVYECEALRTQISSHMQVDKKIIHIEIR